MIVRRPPGESRGFHEEALPTPGGPPAVKREGVIDEPPTLSMGLLFGEGVVESSRHTVQPPILPVLLLPQVVALTHAQVIKSGCGDIDTGEVPLGVRASAGYWEMPVSVKCRFEIVGFFWVMLVEECSGSAHLWGVSVSGGRLFGLLFWLASVRLRLIE